MTGGGVSGRVSVGSGSGGGVRIGGAGGSVVGTGVGISGSGGASALAGPGLFDVNLWLVRSVPGQTDEVTHSTLRMNQDGASFAFPPVAVDTSEGTTMVQVTGSLAVTQTDNGEQQLVFSTGRRITNRRDTTTTVGPPRDHGADVQGIGRTTNPLPGPEEVLSFEMPPITLNGRQAAPDQFSVRLKIAPRRQPSPDQ